MLGPGGRRGRLPGSPVRRRRRGRGPGPSRWLRIRTSEIRIRTAELPVPLARPRDRKSVDFVALVDSVYQLMTNPQVILEDVLGPTQTAPHAMSGPQLSRLPEARPGAMIGLVELLDERGGRADLFRLAEELRIEADELLAPLDALVLLGFARVEEGDAILTEAGISLARADLQGRKVLFREAVVDRAIIVSRIVAALRSKRDGRMPVDFFLDQLERNFTSSEAQAQLATAAHWGSFAELFEVDSDRNEFVRSDVSEPAVA